MVALSPRFTFLATVCALAALSSAPVSDAALLRLRASDPALANMAPGHWLRSHSSSAADRPPVLSPLKSTPVESHKDLADSSDSPGSSGDDNGNVHAEGGKVKVRIF